MGLADPVVGLMSFHLLLALVLTRSTSTSALPHAWTTPNPVSELHVTAYLGRWYQTHASITVKVQPVEDITGIPPELPLRFPVQDTMELGGRCVTADYGAMANRTDVITVGTRAWIDDARPAPVDGATGSEHRRGPARP